MRAIVLGLLLFTACTTDAGRRPDSPNVMRLVDGRLFWTEATAKLVTSDLDGSDVRVIAAPPSTAACITQLAVTQSGLYWNDCDLDLWRADRDGGNAAPVGVAVPSYYFSTDDNAAYGGVYQLDRQPLGGGTAMSLTTGEHVILATARFGEHVYFGAGEVPLGTEANGGIWRVATDGGFEARLIPDDGAASDLVVDAEGIAWTNREGTFRAALDGTGVVKLAEEARSLVLDRGRVFFTTIDDVVMSAAMDGSDVRTLYRGASWLVGPAIAGDQLLLFESDAERQSRTQALGPTTYHLVTVDR